MANESTASTESSTGGASESTQSTTGTGTQGVTTQAEAVQSKTVDQGQSQPQTASTTKEIAVKKPEAKPETTQETQAKLNVNEMIYKQLMGQLSDADVANLEAVGMTKQQIESLADAHKAVQAKNDAAIYEAVGGKEVYAEMHTYALENLSDDEIDVYNEALAHPNTKIGRIAALGLHSMMMAAKGGGKPAERIGDMGNSGAGDVDQAFTSQQELINAMRDSRYGRDRDYTSSIDNRRAKSGF